MELLLADPVDRTAELVELPLTERALPELEDPEVERALELEPELTDPLLERVLLLPLLVLVPLLRRLSCCPELVLNELLLELRELEPELTELLLELRELEPELTELLLERVLEPELELRELELTELLLERLPEELLEERVLLPEDWVVLRVDCPVERELPPPELRVWAIISGAMSMAKATITEPAKVIHFLIAQDVLKVNGINNRVGKPP